VGWISKASAAQRAGRAGRTGPGHCYRLYSSALYENHFDPFSQPEILRMPIDGVVLQMKSMHIDAVANFPFPTAPDRHNLRKAEAILTHLGALSESKTGDGGQITDIGRAMSLFPLSPRYARMLVSGRQHGCLPYVITVVSILSVGDPFTREEFLEADVSEEEDDDSALAHLKSEALRVKEARRLRRKQFFESQQVCLVF
jgi:ATP-dependent RNA helicase DHX37/DHR1